MTTTNAPLYFAYGSNLSPEHRARNECPAEGLRFVGLAQLPDRRLSFTRFSRQWGGGVLDAVPEPGCVVDGALYAVDDDQVWRWLDGREGVAVGAYRQLPFAALTGDGRARHVRTYEVVTREAWVAPSDRYRDVVADGLRAVGLDTARLDAIVATRGAPVALLASVFVYGTLKRGQGNHAVLTGDVAADIVEVVEGTARGALFDCGPYPAMVTDDAGHAAADGVVHGELVTFAPSSFAAALARLDRLEGFRGFGTGGSLYERRVVTVATHAGPRRAWTYVMTSSREMPRLPDGRWPAR